MGFFDFLKRKDVPENVVEQELARQSVEKSRDPYHTLEVKELMRELPRDLSQLRLDEIEKGAETVVNYLRALMKDLAMMADAGDASVRQRYAQNISTKVKLVAQRGLEVRNLIAQLEEHYFLVLMDVVKRVHEKTQDHYLLEMLKRIEADLALEKDAEAKLLKVIAYDERLNAEKNPSFSDEIVRAAQAREINANIQELINVVNRDILDKKQGMLARIKQEQLMEALLIKTAV